MNAHVNQCSGSGPPINQASRCSSEKNSSTVSSGWSCWVMNWSYTLNASVTYAVMRVCLICTASTFCFTLSCLYMAKAPPRNLNDRMRLTFFIVQSSHTSSTFSTYSTMGISVAAPLNSEISRTSNILPSIAKRLYLAKIDCGLKVDFNNVTDSDNPVACVCLRNTPCFKSFPFTPRLFL